jgi:hypothetical protein
MKRALPLIEQLAGGVTALPNAVLPKIEAPAIGPTGELIDTSVEKPTDPQNSAQAQDNAGIGVAAVKPGAPSAAELVKPESPTAPADMVFDPLGVGKQGQRIEVPTTTGPAAPPASGGPSSEMTFSSPMEVPRTGPAAAQPAGTEASGGPAAAGETIAPVVRSFLASGLQVTLFAAGSEGPGYDGMVIEQVSKRSAGRPSGLKTPAAPAAASPPAGAAPAPKPAAQAPTAAQ